MSQIHDIDKLYRTYTGGKIPAKRSIDFWSGLIASGQRTRSEFTAYLGDLDECKSFRRTLVRDALNDAGMSSSLDIEASYILTGVESTAWEFVRSHAPCVASWALIVSEEYSKLKMKTIPDALAKEYMLKWKETKGYTQKELVNDILQESQEKTQESKTQESKTQESKTQEKTQESKTQEKTQESKIQESTSQESKIQESNTREYDREFVQMFEIEFGRPMFVHEYFRYSRGQDSRGQDSRGQDSRGQDSRGQDISIQDHNKRFSRLSSIVSDYVGRELDEYTFVKDYIDSTDRGETFYREFHDSVIASDEYSRVMSKKLVDVHVEMYDEEIEARELVFLFDEVKSQKMKLLDDSLGDRVVDFKAQRDEIVENIRELYSKTLDRMPDPFELEDGIVFWRKNGSLSRDMQEKILCSSLEFHEIIKATIREESQNKDILPSVMYSLLTKLVASGSCDTLDSMKRACRSALGPPL